MDNCNRFNGKVNAYSKGRPGYALKTIKLFNELGMDEQSVIADIGAGTGILSEMLLQRGYKIYSIEPNRDMYRYLKQILHYYSLSKIINATAENTGLEKHSLDFIVVGQAFHWFNPDKFKEECDRVLKSEGTLFLLWNCFNSTTPIIMEIENCFKHYNLDFHGFNAGIKESNIKKVISSPYKISFENDMIYDKKSFLNRWLSSSFSLSSNHPEYHNFVDEINMIFWKHRQNSEYLTLENETIVYFGKLERRQILY